MKVLIAGSRSISDYDLGELIPDDTELIISGGARGIDSAAEKYADKNNISKLIMRPNYKRYGKAAPLIRNKAMLEVADKVIVIWDGKSKGTKYTAELARKLGRELILINLENKRD